MIKEPSQKRAETEQRFEEWVGSWQSEMDGRYSNLRIIHRLTVEEGKKKQTTHPKNILGMMSRIFGPKRSRRTIVNIWVGGIGPHVRRPWLLALRVIMTTIAITVSSYHLPAFLRCQKKGQHLNISSFQSPDEGGIIICFVEMRKLRFMKAKWLS